MANPIARKFWLIVVAAFVLLIGAWTTLIVIATKNRPESIPMKEVEETSEVPRAAE